MAKPPKQFDVWFVTTSTVYKQVPYTVVADWCQQGRLGPADQLRPAGSADAWKLVAAWDLFADYLPREVGVAVAAEPVAVGDAATETAEPIDLDPLPRRRGGGDSDDDVDMIPLIDISMVLLVFFIMLRATGALSSVDVPDMVHAGELSKDPNAVTLSIEKADETTVKYSVRVGEQPVPADNANLTSPSAAMARLNAVIDGLEKPPHVRIACSQQLPSQRVFELIPDLKAMKAKKRINGFTAEVNEAPRTANEAPRK